MQRYAQKAQDKAEGQEPRIEKEAGGRAFFIKNAGKADQHGDDPIGDGGFQHVGGPLQLARVFGRPPLRVFLVPVLISLPDDFYRKSTSACPATASRR